MFAEKGLGCIVHPRGGKLIDIHKNMCIFNLALDLGIFKQARTKGDDTFVNRK